MEFFDTIPDFSIMHIPYFGNLNAQQLDILSTYRANTPIDYATRSLENIGRILQQGGRQGGRQIDRIIALPDRMNVPEPPSPVIYDTTRQVGAAGSCEDKYGNPVSCDSPKAAMRVRVDGGVEIIPRTTGEPGVGASPNPPTPGEQATLNLLDQFSKGTNLDKGTLTIGFLAIGLVIAIIVLTR
jgi:hypothetical protein